MPVVSSSVLSLVVRSVIFLEMAERLTSKQTLLHPERFENESFQFLDHLQLAFMFLRSALIHALRLEF